MAYDETLAARIRQALARRKHVEEKRMFGGVGFLLHGNMLVCVWEDSLIVRLGPDEGDETLKEPHVREFDITGRPMKGWVPVGSEGVEDDEQVKGWIERAMRFVGKLPGKSKSGKLAVFRRGMSPTPHSFRPLLGVACWQSANSSGNS